MARRDRDTIGRLSGGVAFAVSVVSFKTLTICSIYLPPHTQITVRDMEELVEQLPKPFYLGRRL